MLIHGPDLIEAVFVALFKTFEFVLKLLKLLCELFVVLCQLNILLLEVFALSVKLFLDRAKYVLIPSFFRLERVDCDVVDLFTLLKHLVIEFEFLLVKAVDGLHVLHAFLEDLHFLLKLDFLLSLVICVLGAQIFQLLSIIFLIFRAFMLEMLL